MSLDLTVVKTNATDFVDSKFNIAMEYADAAKGSLDTFLTDMSNQLSDYTGVPLTILPVTFPDAYVYVKPDTFPTSPPVPTNIPDAPSNLEVTHTDDVTANLTSTNFTTALNAALTSSKLLSASEEQALYSRAVNRKDLENERLETNAMNLFASRGFEVPSQALLAQIAEAASEQTRNTLEINAEVLAKSGEYAIQAASVALQVASAYEKTWLDQLNAINDRAVRLKVENVSRLLQAYATTAKVLVDVYTGEVQAYGTEIQALLGVEQIKVAATDSALKIAYEKKQTILSEAELTLKNKQTVLQLQIESLKTSASVSAQVIASALNSVNASASFGFQGSAQEGSSFSTDLTKGIVSKSVSENVSYTGADLAAGTNPPLA